MSLDHTESPSPSYHLPNAVSPAREALSAPPATWTSSTSVFQLHIQSGPVNFILNCIQTY